MATIILFWTSGCQETVEIWLVPFVRTIRLTSTYGRPSRLFKTNIAIVKMVGGKDARSDYLETIPFGYAGYVRNKHKRCRTGWRNLSASSLWDSPKQSFLCLNRPEKRDHVYPVWTPKNPGKCELKAEITGKVDHPALSDSITYPGAVCQTIPKQTSHNKQTGSCYSESIIWTSTEVNWIYQDGIRRVHNPVLSENRSTGKWGMDKKVFEEIKVLDFGWVIGRTNDLEISCGYGATVYLSGILPTPWSSTNFPLRLRMLLRKLIIPVILAYLAGNKYSITVDWNNGKDSKNWLKKLVCLGRCGGW